MICNNHCNIVVDKVMKNQNKVKLAYYDYNAHSNKFIFYFSTLPTSKMITFEASYEDLIDNTEKVIIEIIDVINTHKA